MRGVLSDLGKLRDAVTMAEIDLEDYLLALHESGHWQQLTYAEMGAAMGCSRQAVQQRVHRMLDRAKDRRRRERQVVNPDQLTIDG